KINGATDPVVLGFTTTPNINNNQADLAGTQTIQAADVTLTTSTMAAGNINQGTNSNIIYVTKIDVATEPVSVNNISFKLNGTFDATDLATVQVYFNPSSPTVGGSFLGSTSAAFATGHLYSIAINNNVAAGGSGYYVITANLNSDATDNNTIKINGATDPVVLGFTTSPNINNNQSDLAGTQTIQASDITLSTSPVTSNVFPTNSTSNIVYIARIAVATEPISVNNISFTLNGTFDASDLSAVQVYFNPSAPAVGGSFLGSTSAAFASGHPYSIAINNNVAAGGSGYYVITVNVQSSATTGHTVLINGSTDPVVLGYTTSPNITNNQTNNGGSHTLPLTFANIKAYENLSAVEVEWSVTNDGSIKTYLVERSGNGTTFDPIGNVNALFNGGAASSYKLKDARPLTGINFYRIRALHDDGKIEYSAIVKIHLNKGFEGISVYPNPIIKNGLFNLQIQNLPKGHYSLTIYNVQGQRLREQEINHIGGSSVQQISLKGIAGGIYSIELLNNGSRYVKTIMVE
ncbi:MAG: T9SS type A sorting domain-containing protein, partial [Ginsengibacter sp.]